MHTRKPIMKRTPDLARRLTLTLLLAGCCSLSGCFSSDQAAIATANFDHATHQLARSVTLLLEDANTTETEHYIDAQAFERAPLATSAIDSHQILTHAELKLREDALEALGRYTVALATLASGKPQAELAKSADAASASLKGVGSDVAGAAAPSSSMAAGIVQAAVSASEQVLLRIERRKSRDEIRSSVRLSEPAIDALLSLLQQESIGLYARERSTADAELALAMTEYNRVAAAAAPDQTLFELAARVKRARERQTRVQISDPTPAFAAFAKAHSTLVAALLAPTSTDRNRLLNELPGQVDTFAGQADSLARTLDANRGGA